MAVVAGLVGAGLCLPCSDVETEEPMRLTLTLAALLMAAAANAGDNPVVVAEQEGWVTRSLGNWCHILNRDSREFNVASYNALAFHRAGGSKRVGMRVHFWPGAFEDDEPVILTVESADGAAVLEYTGMTTGDSIVDLDHETTRQDLDRFIAAGWIVVRASGVEPVLAFDTHGLAGPLADLDRCAIGLKQN
jgi:hypothetical protein